jgi:hypothetical protein
VRTRFVVFLMILAIPLMGSDCAVAVRSGVPPPQGGNNPPPNTGGGGGVIIVASGDSAASEASVVSLRLDRAMVVSTLAVSVWTPPDREREAAGSTIHGPASIQVRDMVVRPSREVGFDRPIAMVGAPPSLAVPEPKGFVLFAVGLWIISNVSLSGGAHGRAG